MPALAELPRTVLLAIRSADAADALRAAAESEGFEILDCGDRDDVLHRVRTEQPPIVVLEATMGRSLDDLADDAREIIESYPEGATVAYLTTTPPPASGIRPEITDWLVWPASQSHLRTKLRAWLLRRGLSLAGRGVAGRRVRRGWPRSGTSGSSTPSPKPGSTVTPRSRARRSTSRSLWCRWSTPTASGSSPTPGSPSTIRRATSRCARTPFSATRRSSSPTRSTTTGSPTTPTCATDARLRFYAGVPLTLSDGHRVGTLCIMDHRPRVLDDAQIERLEQLGRMVEADLEAAEEEPADLGA